MIGKMFSVCIEMLPFSATSAIVSGFFSSATSDRQVRPFSRIGPFGEPCQDGRRMFPSNDYLYLGVYLSKNWLRASLRLFNSAFLFLFISSVTLLAVPIRWL
jgi:hypothetical protein